MVAFTFIATSMLAAVSMAAPVAQITAELTTHRGNPAGIVSLGSAQPAYGAYPPPAPYDSNSTSSPSPAASAPAPASSAWAPAPPASTGPSLSAPTSDLTFPGEGPLPAGGSPSTPVVEEGPFIPMGDYPTPQYPDTYPASPYPDTYPPSPYPDTIPAAQYPGSYPSPQYPGSYPVPQSPASYPVPQYPAINPTPQTPSTPDFEPATIETPEVIETPDVIESPDVIEISENEPEIVEISEPATEEIEIIEVEDSDIVSELSEDCSDSNWYQPWTWANRCKTTTTGEVESVFTAE